MKRLAGMIVVGIVAVAGNWLAGSTAAAEVVDEPYASRLAMDVNPDPNVFETSISAYEATVDVGNGVMATMMTYNGMVPGPEIRVKPGDRVIVHFQNDLTEPVGIHWHGIELANDMDGTPFTQNEIQPGARYIYDFIAPRPGVHWYHPHHHFSTNQVFKGLYGAIVVEDPNNAALVADGTLPGADQTMTLVLSDTTVCKAPGSNDTATYDPSLPWAGGGPLPVQSGETPTDLCDTPKDNHGDPLAAPLPAGSVPNIQQGGKSGQHREGQTVLTNGRNVGHRDGSPSSPGALDPAAVTTTVQPGQGIRMKLVDAAAIRFFRLRMTLSDGTQVPLVRIGGEGGLLDDAVLDGTSASGYVFKYEAGEVLLDPGDRADVVAVIPPGATGVATLWTLDVSRTGAGWNNIPTVPVAHFRIDGPPVSPAYSITAGTPLRSATGDFVEVLPAATGMLLDPNTLPTPSPGMADQNIALTNNPLGVNGVPGEHDFTIDYYRQPTLGSTRFARIGDILELTVENTTGSHHPYHLHGFSFQPLEVFDCATPVPGYTIPREFVDNFDVPPGCKLRFRVRLHDRALTDGVTPGGGLGRWMFHCHIFFHHHFGMFGELVVTDRNGNQRPYIDTDTPYFDAESGGGLIATFTVFDPDGDAMTVTSTRGTLTDNGDGTWTLNQPGPVDPGRIFVTVTDSAGNTGQSTIEVTGPVDTPPVLEIDPAQVTEVDEGQELAIDASFTDEGVAGDYQATVDVGDGNGPQAVTAVVDDSGVPVTGTIDTTHTYGDDGIYTVVVSVTDPSGNVADATFDVTVHNVDPSPTTDSSVLTVAGQPTTLTGLVTDPGSDDLTTVWELGDGASDTHVSLVNPPAADPPLSPSVQPRLEIHEVTHTYEQGCVYEGGFSAGDDDGGAGGVAVTVVVLDVSDIGLRNAGYWAKQMGGAGNPQIAASTLNCYLAIANELSMVFSEVTAATTAGDAFVLLSVKGNASPVELLDRQILTTWLNVASGALSLDMLVDTDGDGNGDTNLFTVLTDAETVRLNTTSPRSAIEATKDLLERVNSTRRG